MEARRIDPVVDAHFADFGLNTKITKLKEDMYVYVSYRKGNRVFWTKKKHKVCKGETVITDGQNMARVRCANRLSREFKAPSLVFQEPKPPELDVIEPPDSSYADAPIDPLLAQNFPQYPRIEEFAPESAQTGAAPGPLSKLPTEPLVPGFEPVAGLPPALFSPVGAVSSPGTGGAPGGGSGGTPGGGGGGTPGGGGGGTPGGGGGGAVPEPSSFALGALSSSLLLWLGRRQYKRSQYRTLR